MKDDQMQEKGTSEASRRDRDETFSESGRMEETAQKAERSDTERQELERSEQMDRSQPAEEDLLLHDDDEAELDLPR